MQTPLKFLPLLRGSRFAFPLAALAALAMFFISESSYQQARTSFDSLVAGTAVRNDIQLLWRSLTEAETEQRGYLVTGRRDRSGRYEEAGLHVVQALGRLQEAYADEPEAAGLFKAVSDASGQKLSELKETLRLFDEGKKELWRELMLSNIGQESMDTVRSVSERLLVYEVQKQEASRAKLAQTLLLNRIGVSAMTALSLLALYMYLRQTTNIVREREEQRQLMQIERERLEGEVLIRTDQLTDLARHLQTVREDERHRLARELHDELGALLTAAKLDVARLKSRLGSGVAPEVAERLIHLSDALNSGIALKRRIIEDLRPSSLSNLGLVAALEILVREWSLRNEIKVDSDFQPVQLRPAGELTVYRLVQEALTNITKYAKATEVQVRLASSEGQVQVSVRDNGVGFDMAARHSSAHGLLGMRYRLETEGGHMVLTSALNKGTVIRAELPESREQAAILTVPVAFA